MSCVLFIGKKIEWWVSLREATLPVTGTVRRVRLSDGKLLKPEDDRENMCWVSPSVRLCSGRPSESVILLARGCTLVRSYRVGRGGRERDKTHVDSVLGSLPWKRLRAVGQ
jgi:hypothetical protein